MLVSKQHRSPDTKGAFLFCNKPSIAHYSMCYALLAAFEIK